VDFVARSWETGSADEGIHIGLTLGEGLMVMSSWQEHVTSQVRELGQVQGQAQAPVTACSLYTSGVPQDLP
jgi:hypothetical protein